MSEKRTGCSTARMEERKMKWQRRLLVASVISTLCATGWSLPIPEVSVDPVAQIVGVGELFTVDILIKDAMDLFGFDMTISFDSSLVSWVGTTISPMAFLGNPMIEAFYIVDTVGVAGVRLAPSGVSGSGVLFSLTFQSLDQGVSEIGLSGMLVDSSASSIEPATIENARVEIVPEPLSATLLVLGTLGIATVHGKRGRRA